MTKTYIMINKIGFTIGLLLFVSEVFSQNFTEKQTAIIYNEAIKTLRNYQDYSNQMADAVTNIDESNKISQRLIDQFVSRKAIIYNDLDPAHKLSEVYELETYVANVSLWYPDGMKISIDFDNIKAGNIISHGNDIFTVDLMTSKKIDGNYLNKQKNENREELLFRIAFFKKGSGFENYKIAGVRSTKSTTTADDSKLLAEVKSVVFSDKDMQLIKDQTKAMLNDYINFLNLITDPKETSEDKAYYRISFLGLFKDSTINVANDIEPNPKDRWVSVKDYQKNLVSSYPEGIRNLGLNLDSAEYGKVVAEGNEKFYINGYIDKFFSGKYMSKSVFRDNSKYDFKVSFNRDENTFKNFKLASIDKFGVNFYQNTSNTTQELPQKPISSLTRDGLYLGLSTGGGFIGLNDKNITGNALLPWSVKGNSDLNIEANATWYITNKLGVKMGIGYSNSSSNANLNVKDSTINNLLLTDPDGYTYNTVVKANSYDSLTNFKYLLIPISVLYHSNGNPEKLGFYAELGMIAGLNMNSTFKTTGRLETIGHYPDETIPSLINIYNVKEFGFYTRPNASGKSDLSGLSLAIKTSFGVTYPLSYFTSIYIGPEFTWSLNSISNTKDYKDVFGNITTAKKVGISKYGIKFGISYKF